jgi:hypothetical protein
MGAGPFLIFSPAPGLELYYSRGHRMAYVKQAPGSMCKNCILLAREIVAHGFELPSTTLNCSLLRSEMQSQGFEARVGADMSCSSLPAGGMVSQGFERRVGMDTDWNLPADGMVSQGFGSRIGILCSSCNLLAREIVAHGFELPSTTLNCSLLRSEMQSQGFEARVGADMSCSSLPAGGMVSQGFETHVGKSRNPRCNLAEL